MLFLPGRHSWWPHRPDSPSTEDPAILTPVGWLEGCDISHRATGKGYRYVSQTHIYIFQTREKSQWTPTWPKIYKKRSKRELRQRITSSQLIFPMGCKRSVQKLRCFYQPRGTQKMQMVSLMLVLHTSTLAKPPEHIHLGTCECESLRGWNQTA